MGFFSWKTCDTNRSISNAYSSRGTFVVYLLCPDGTRIEENRYEGYGIFGGHDVYDLVADWNKEYIGAENINKPKRESYSEVSWYADAVDRYNKRVKRIEDFKVRSDEYMKEHYGVDYKRGIGIDIACYNDQNAALKYPIKFAEYKHSSYDDMPPAVICSDQGYFYG